MFGHASELAQFNECLATGRHDRAMPLFDKIVQDDLSARLVLESVLMSVANQNDPSLAIVHGVATVDSARQLIALAPFPACRPLLRFVALYAFSLVKRRLTAEDVRIHAQQVPQASAQEVALAEAVGAGQPDLAAAILGRIALDAGLDAAGHAALRLTFGEIGRLGHNLSLAVSYVEAARSLGLPRGLLLLANLAIQQCRMMPGVRLVETPPIAITGAPVSGGLTAALADGNFRQVEELVGSHCAAGDAQAALRPLLIAGSADPGFLGHNLSLVHSAALASRYLSPDENAALIWKLYRTTDTKFSFPDFLRLRGSSAGDRDGAISALQATLQHRTPPAEKTLRHALEAGVTLEEIAELVVGNYGAWRVGEKEHTIGYLNASIQVARGLGRDEAMLPLVIALSKLPF